MAQTTNLLFSLLEASQSQKHVLVNEALQKLDNLVQLVVEDITLSTPPSGAIQGQAWIVAAGATEAWLNQDNHIAIWRDGNWDFIVPLAGWFAFDKTAQKLIQFNGAIWQENIGNLTVSSLNLITTTTTTATIGAATLPASPVGFIDILINGQGYKIPFYNQ